MSISEKKTAEANMEQEKNPTTATDPAGTQQPKYTMQPQEMLNNMVKSFRYAMPAISEELVEFLRELVNGYSAHLSATKQKAEATDPSKE